MSKYIKDTDITNVLCDASDGDADTIAAFMELADKLPAADVVEVVRCAECEHLLVMNEHTKYAICTKTRYAFIPFETDTRTYFCAFGKRKETA